MPCPHALSPFALLDLCAPTHNLWMLQERFNESLLLLGKCLGLEAADLVPPPGESAAAKPVTHTLPVMPEDRKAIEKLNHLDMALYSHTQKLFEQRLRLAMAAEVSFAVPLRDESMAVKVDEPGALEGEDLTREEKAWLRDHPEEKIAAEQAMIKEKAEQAALEKGAEAVSAAVEAQASTAARFAAGCNSTEAAQQWLGNVSLSQWECHAWRWSEKKIAHFHRCVQHGGSHASCFDMTARVEGMDGGAPDLLSQDDSTGSLAEVTLHGEPLWFGARIATISQGTTATHGIFEALLRMRLPAVHYDLVSPATSLGEDFRARLIELNNTRMREDGKYVSALNTSVEVSPFKLRLSSRRPSPFEGHDRLMAAYEQAATCANDWYGIVNPDQADCLDQSWLQQVEEGVRIAANERYSTSDVPYSSFLSLFVEADRDRTLFVMLDHDTDDWVRGRLECEHMNGPICREEFWDTVDNPFDLHACVASCLSRGGAHCVVTFNDVGAESLADAYRRQLSQITRIFDSRDDLLRLNLFEQPMEPEVIASQLRDALCKHGLGECKQTQGTLVPQIVG